MRYPLALLLPLLLCTCGPALDTVEETDEQGFRTVYQVDPETKSKQGTAQRFFPDGKLMSEEQYVDGQLDGTRTAYYPDGKKELVETYRAGQFEGDYMTYDSLGNLRLRGVYTDGVMQGQWTRYFPDGGVREVVTFADNRENGPFREWYANGQPHYAGTYLNGKEEGTLWAYNEAGVLIALRNCEAAICTSYWKDTDGTPPPDKAPDMSRPAAGTTE